MGDERQRMNEMLIVAAVRTGQTLNQVLTARFISPQWTKSTQLNVVRTER